MTKAQIKKLHTILDKLESLQAQVGTDRARELLGKGKDELLYALREFDH